MTAKIELLLATRNAGKLHELRQIIENLPVVVSDLDAFPQVREVPETGHTFAENATLKAVGYAVQARQLTLADDSGLEIDALHGEPGIFSARYLGDDVSFAARIRSLLERLSKVQPDSRTARFVCAIAVADETGAVLNTSMGICEGRVAYAPRGEGGFGYDPIFIPHGYESTFAELSPTIKNQISHRARALEALREYLQNLTRCIRAD